MSDLELKLLGKAAEAEHRRRVRAEATRGAPSGWAFVQDEVWEVEISADLHLPNGRSLKCSARAFLGEHGYVVFSASNCTEAALEALMARWVERTRCPEPPF